MALPPLAQVSDLAAWVGQEIPAADPRAGAVLSAASTLVRTYTDQMWVTVGGALADDVPDAVAAVVVQVASRVWLNPTGAVQVGAGPYSERRSEGVVKGLYLTEDEKDILAGFSASDRPADLGVLSTTRGPLSADRTIYVPTGPPPSGPPFPWYSQDD